MPRTYADNSYNRSLGRVGMAHGTAVVSRSGGGSSGSYGGSGGSYGGASRSYGGSSAYGSSGSSGYSGSSSARTYVDNAHNRSLGRVGMVHGTAVESRSGSTSSYGSSGISSGSTRTYVDNAHNRSLGRVGMPHGTAVESRSGSSRSCGSSGISSGSTRTYVDNAHNRSLGRVGLPHGTAVESRSGSSRSCDNSGASGNSGSTKTYVDNAQNRKLGRVGKEHGTAVHSKSDTSASPTKVYVDNPMNRRLGRVGRPKGTMPHSKSSSTNQSSKRCYVDNPMNRALGRVGYPIGTMPVGKKSKETKALKEMLQKMMDQMNDPGDELVYDDWMDDECVMDYVNRVDQERMWRNEHGQSGHPHTNSELLQRYQGVVIPFEYLDLQEKIGHGGFGDVHYAEWDGSVVAVKKLRVQRVSQKRLKEFTDELMVFCTLEHPNIVKFIGACVVTPNLAIVMEYMQGCLFAAIHMDGRDFSEEDRLSMIKQIIRGLEYLHGQQIAHCDLKSKNVLLNVEGGRPVVKLTDFGLSMMRAESESSSSAAECVRNIGTPRYSAPEVLRGELLNRAAMMKADMYSVSLIVFEIVYEDEPFPKMNYQQLCNNVGNGTATPDIPSDIHVHYMFKRALEDCWSRAAGSRPSASGFLAAIESLPYLMEK